MQFIRLLSDKEQELKLADYRKFSFLFLNKSDATNHGNKRTDNIQL